MAHCVWSSLQTARATVTSISTYLSNKRKFIFYVFRTEEERNQGNSTQAHPTSEVNICRCLSVLLEKELVAALVLCLWGV